MSSHEGRFRMELAPGRYVLTAKVPVAGLMPRPAQVTVTVQPDAFAKVTITLDSGIRLPGAPPPLTGPTPGAGSGR